MLHGRYGITKIINKQYPLTMKKYLFFLCLLPICTWAQIIQENELAVVYYMPLTQIAITIEYDEIHTEPGVFYQYAELYLGTKDIITTAQTQYQLTSVSIATRTLPDKDRAYKIVPQKGIYAQLIALTDNGILYGYNVPPLTNIPSQYTPVISKEASWSTPMPLLEEQMMANSTAKMAEGAAKQIYHLRETRLNILAGDVEHAPADGQAMQLVMDELNLREQQLTDLFIGKKTSQHHTQTIYYTPTEQTSSTILYRLSQFSGLVPADDLSGEPIYINIHAHKQSLTLEKDATNKNAAKPSQLYYNLPGSADIQIIFNGTTQASATYSVAQYGVAIPLALDLFSGKNIPHIYFNTETGNISSIQQ